jgi:hypothetical protein
MIFQEEIEKWNAKWKYDFWWRRKYNISFGSKQHREVSQIDISFEYFENRLYEKTIEKIEEDKEKKKVYKETRRWINEPDSSKDLDSKLFDRLDLKKLNVKKE